MVLVLIEIDRCYLYWLLTVGMTTRLYHLASVFGISERMQWSIVGAGQLDRLRSLSWCYMLKAITRKK